MFAKQTQTNVDYETWEAMEEAHSMLPIISKHDGFAELRNSLLAGNLSAYKD